MTIRPLLDNDITEMVSAFQAIGWHKPQSLFANYIIESEKGERSLFIARDQGEFCGYVTVKWRSSYASFLEKNIPEIADLNVLPSFQRRGIGKQLINACEALAIMHGHTHIGLGMGLLADYGDAQKLYYQLGYRPDGHGIYANHQTVQFDTKIAINDDVVLYLIKSLTTNAHPLQQLLNLEQQANDFGFAWPNQQMIIEQLIDECSEISDALKNQESRYRIQEEIGDLLHAAISLCDFIGFSITETLEKVCVKFNKRLQAIKRLTQQAGLNDLHGQDFKFMLTLWKEAKILTEENHIP